MYRFRRMLSVRMMRAMVFTVLTYIYRLGNFRARFSEDVAEEYRARYRKMHNLVVTAHRAERDVSEVFPQSTGRLQLYPEDSKHSYFR